MPDVRIARHRTALQRVSLSRPLTLALNDHVLESHHSVFDYGCGRGGDVVRLREMGLTATGWDPVHSAMSPRVSADAVNLGYVLNVIEDSAERVQAIRQAWSLTRSVLIVSVRVTWDERDLQGTPFRDGVLTRLNTFQKFFTHDEVRSLLEAATGEQQVVAAAPGVFYVFKDPALGQAYLSRRVRVHIVKPRLALLDRHRELLRPLADFMLEYGRLPRPGELVEAEAIRSQLGGLGRACRAIVASLGEDRWQQLRDQRHIDTLIYVALSKFGRRPLLSQLPLSLQGDVKEFFSTYSAACALADTLLFSVGSAELLREAATSSPAGKRTATAIYVHRSAIGLLPPRLRLLHGCAEVLSGAVEGANIIKLSLDKPKVSYLAYPDFDSDPHPALQSSIAVRLDRLRVYYRRYGNSPNRPILHRKEEFVPREYPLRAKFARLTVQEERYGLYRDTARIGTEEGWSEALSEAGVRLVGHRIVRSR